MIRTIIAAAIVALSAPVSATSARTDAVLPQGHHVLAEARMTAGSPLRTFRIVALGSDGETSPTAAEAPSAPRPLIVIEETAGPPRIIARNDQVVMRADEGGQCDPFEPNDASGRIKVKGNRFTVENGVACGLHWSIATTFRLDDRLGFVFSDTRTETWTQNPYPRPGGPALVRDAPVRIERADPRRPVRLDDWVPNPEN